MKITTIIIICHLNTCMYISPNNSSLLQFCLFLFFLSFLLCCFLLFFF
uniref:Uncharacterized protein n=1 Tax=Amphimedon queenslandica TaxID=400682 RepID=A0A1X7SYA0_AMPQE